MSHNMSHNILATTLRPDIFVLDELKRGWLSWNSPIRLTETLSECIHTKRTSMLFSCPTYPVNLQFYIFLLRYRLADRLQRRIAHDLRNLLTGIVLTHVFHPWLYGDSMAICFIESYLTTICVGPAVRVCARCNPTNWSLCMIAVIYFMNKCSLPA